MKNTLFDAASLRILLSPEAWRMVGSLLDREVESIGNRRHLVWMKSHVDRHPAREVLISLKGSGVYGFQGNVYPCVPGTVFLFDSYEPHDNYYPPGCPRMRHLWLYIFESGVIARILDVDRGRITLGGKSSIILTGTEAAGLLIATWNELADAPLLPGRFKRAKLVAALEAIVTQIVETGYGATPKPTRQGFTAAVIQTIQRHVERNAGRGIPLGEAARLAGYSKYHFFRLFQRHTGQTYHAYVDACRIKKARAMLAKGCRKKEISETLGFAHPSVFLRWMNRTEGRSLPRAPWRGHAGTPRARNGK